MKRLLIVTVSIALFTISGHSQEPEKLTSLRSSWQRARDQVTQPVDTKYRTALQQMMDAFTKSGDLNGALAVKAELDKLSPSAQVEGKPSGISEAGKKIRYRYEFISDGCSFETATERAKAAGGILAFPRDDKEVKEFRELADKAKAPQIWLGVSREAITDAKWICSDGSEFDPKLVSKIGFRDDASRKSLRLGDGSALNANSNSSSLPFIIATPK